MLLIVIQATVSKLQTKLDMLSHEHEDIMGLLQSLLGSKVLKTDGALTQEISDTLKYLKEKLDLPGPKKMLKGGLLLNR